MSIQQLAAFEAQGEVDILLKISNGDATELCADFDAKRCLLSSSDPPRPEGCGGGCSAGANGLINCSIL